MSPDRIARWVATPIALAAISTSGILIRLTEAPPLATAAYRMLGASAILLTFALVRQRAELRSLTRDQVRLLAAGGVLVGVHFALWTSALFNTSVASAVLLTDTHPVFVALGAWAFLGERTPSAVWLGIAIAMVGSAVIGIGDLQLGGTALVGDAMAIGAAITFAGYLVIGRHVRQRLGVAVYAGTVYGIGGLVIAGMAGVSGTSLTTFSERDLLAWLGLILIPTMAGHTVFNWALRHLPASVVGVSILGEPVLTTTWAWLLLHEAPPPTAFVGGAAILAGLYLALRSRTGDRPDAEKEPLGAGWSSESAKQ